jgi:D-alanyl-D-alanine dipeptidase
MKNEKELQAEWGLAFEQVPTPNTLVDIPEEDFRVNIDRDRSLYEQLGMTGDKFSLQVTAETLKALYRAQENLLDNEQLEIISAYRPAELLLGLWLRRMGTVKEQFPEWSIDERVEFGTKYTASPYHPGFPPHSRGDAVDVMLYRDGEEVVLNKQSETPELMYEQMAVDFFKGKDEGIHSNRLHLQEVMTSAGFISYDREFWHFGLTPVFPEVKNE